MVGKGHDDRKIVGRLIDCADFALAEGVVQRIAQTLHVDAQSLRLVAIKDQSCLQAVSFGVGIQVSEDLVGLTHLFASTVHQRFSWSLSTDCNVLVAAGGSAAGKAQVLDREIGDRKSRGFRQLPCAGCRRRLALRRRSCAASA